MNTNDPTPRSMSIVQAVQLLRTADAEKMPLSDAATLLTVMERNPALHIMVGSREDAEKFQAVLQRRCGSSAEDSNAVNQPAVAVRSKFKSWLKVAALLIVCLCGMWAWKAQQADLPSPAVRVAKVPEEVKPLAPMVAASPAAIEDKPIAPVPPPIPIADPLTDEPVIEVANGPATLVKEGEGIYRLTELNNHTTVKLRGKMKELRIEEVNGSASLDASELTAERVEFLNDINGHAEVKLNAPEGRVHFSRGVNGESKLTIHAPGGEVLFDEPAKINGTTQTTITARKVALYGKISGASMLGITLTSGGKLYFTRIEGSSILTYRKAKKEDPKLAITEGKRSEGAAVVQAEP